MHLRHSISFLSLMVLAGVCGSAVRAQTTAGAGTVIVLPLAAYIPGVYETTVFVRNPNPNAINLAVRYYQSDSATPAGTGTPLTCGQLSVPASAATTFELGTQCVFSGTDNFGQIVLEDVTASQKTNVFLAYSRTEFRSGGSLQNGNGFSVEGFPVGNFSSATAGGFLGFTAESIGLKRTVGAPHYRSNCFVGALNEPVNYQVQLFQGETGALLGAVAPATLGAYHSVRYLDIFAQAGLANIDYSNVRAKFVSSNNAALIGFCTLETSDNGSADFRIAKSIDARDTRQSRLACFGMDSCGSNVSSATDPAQITDITQRNVHYLIIDQPDFVKCDLVSDATTPRLNDLEMRLRVPGDPLTSPQFTPGAPYNVFPPYTSGGDGQTGFYIYTGEKSTIASGSTTRWYIDVSFREGGNTTTPIKYGIKCYAGNGLTVPWLGGTGPDNF